MIQLMTQHLGLRTTTLQDWLRLKDFEIRNKHHLGPWETITASASDDSYQKRLEQWQCEFVRGTAVRFFLMNTHDADTIIGACNFTQIFRGFFQACYLGYKIDYAYQGKGFLTEALTVAIHYMFAELNLHRIMANYMPANVRSAQLLQRLGFTVEGQAKEYLLINNKWEDHIVTPLLIKIGNKTSTCARSSEG